MGQWRNGILSSSVEATSSATEPPGALVLGSSRTKRPNILNRFKRCHVGLNIVDKHYSAPTPIQIQITWILFFSSFLLLLPQLKKK
ncbi:hypothetical protein L6452_04995 [Arctium lappa]|uniref:Uncharacterized protein n=1 Tax=Arctium lappa TaxID=4217 RepID=A0ACB9EFS8_ARCLA|nr:hypothetical protein L6452_04995 [Arctium lappa]